MRGLFHIPPRHAFVDALAEGLLDVFGGDNPAFADALLLLPNRRAVRALRDAFLRATNGRPLLLATSTTTSWRAPPRRRWARIPGGSTSCRRPSPRSGAKRC
jgi:hypothetical protein